MQFIYTHIYTYTIRKHSNKYESMVETVRCKHISYEILPSQANNPFVKEISSAKFYYLDKFLLLTSGSGLYLYKYHIDISKPDDIKRCT